MSRMTSMTPICISLEHGFGEDLLIRNVWMEIGRGRRQEILRHALVLGLHEMAKSGRLPSHVSRIVAEFSDNMDAHLQGHGTSVRQVQAAPSPNIAPVSQDAPSMASQPLAPHVQASSPMVSPSNSSPNTKSPSLSGLPETGMPEAGMPEAGMPAQASTRAEATKEVAAKNAAQGTPKREADGFVPSKKLGRLM
jgi:hypothetical protein